MSFVWHAKKLNKDEAQCNHCLKTYKLGGGTSSLILHLKNQHSEMLKNAAEKVEAKRN